MLIVSSVVVLITSIIVVLCLLLYHQQTQRALIWWHSRQWMRMYQEAEMIHNDLLQESFVIRRQLEISSLNPSLYQQMPEQCYLATIEKFHHSLKELSEYLSPAHIEDSLPLAIQHVLVKWRARIPELNLQMELPTEWPPESLYTIRVILIALEELLQIIFSNIPNKLSIFVSVKTLGNFHELMVCCTDLNISQQTYIWHFTELDYLRHAFNFLTSGKCFYQHKYNTAIWHFRWRHLPNNLN
ncbi:hypothetical protein NIES2100_20080 [Calothrix sp. NIES-2100]|uniref:hypothetical protein n=1 Tax=Calothrix sp. NIES-2100 TaxID=1954172 RepID=UPI000B5FE9C4|nr:hypothetical protein NIES2100_20080 [Calothrix sp. NIES-2100]